MAIADSTVIELFVNTFGKAPTAAEVTTWSSSSSTTNGLATLMNSDSSSDFNTINNTVYNLTTDYINAMYLKLFDRDADAEGLEYWGAKLDDGAVTKGNFVKALIEGAKAYPASGTYAALANNDKTLVANKTTVATDFVDKGLTDTNLAISVIMNVTTELSTVTSSLTSIQNEYDLVQAAASAGTDTTFELTTSMDQLSGTGEADLFTGSNTGVAANDTINFGDTIAGGDGSDTLKMYISGDANLGNLFLNSVDNVWITNTDNSTDIDAQEWTATTSIEFYKPTVTTAVSNVQNNATIKLTDFNTDIGNTADVDVDFASSVLGTSATLTLVLEDVEDGTDETELRVTTTGTDTVTVLDITSNGTSSTFELDMVGSVTDFTTLNVAGAGDLTLTVNDDELENLTTISASTMTGGLSLDLATEGAQDDGTSDAGVTVTTGEGDDTLVTTGQDDTITTGAGDDTINAGAGNDTVTSGAGDDTVTTGAGGTDTVDAGAGDDTVIAGANLSTNDSLDGGADTDTISLTSAGFVTAAVDTDLLATLSNFEKVLISNSFDDTGDDNDVSILGFGTNYAVLGTDPAATQTISGFTSSATVESIIDADMTNGLTISITNATDLDNDSDVLNLSANADLESGETHDLIYEIAGIETVNISTSDFSTLDGTTAESIAGTDPDTSDGYTLDLDGNTNDNDARLETLTITGGYSLDYTGTDSSDRLKTIDASAATGDIIINVSANDTKAVTITTNTGTDNITASNNGDTISTGAGDDTITGGTGDDTIDGGAGDDDIDAGNGDDTVIIDTLTNTTDDDTDGDAGSDTLKIYDAVVGTGGIAQNTIDLTSFDDTILSDTDVFDLYSTFENVDASLVTTTTKSLKMIGADAVDNTFIGGAAADTYTTGTGNDTIEIRAGYSADGKEDYITDFTTGTDTLVLSGNQSSSGINLEALTVTDNGDTDNNTFQYTDLGSADVIMHFSSTDLTNSVQLGRTYAETLNDDADTAVTRTEYFTTTGSVTAGDAVDRIEAGSSAQTFKLGASNDVLLIKAADSVNGSEDTVTDLAVGDLIILTGSHSSNAIDLTDVTVGADLGGGIYEYSTLGITDLKLNIADGGADNTEDLKGYFQLGTSQSVFTSTADITAGDSTDFVQSGSGAQTIDLGDGNDKLLYNSASTDASGNSTTAESIDGGAGAADTIVIAGGTTAVNLSDDTIANFEVLELKKDIDGNNDNKDQSVTLTIAQLGAFTVNTDNEGASGDKITLSDALTAAALDATVINGDLKLVLANANNSLTTVDALMTSTANDLYIDGSTLTGTNALTFDGSAEVEATFYITSGTGDDTITGGQNEDTITVGTGADTIIYTATAEFGDTITDFNLSADDIDLSDVAVAPSFTGYSEITAKDAIDTGTNGMFVADYNLSTASDTMTAAELYSGVVSATTNLGAVEVAYILVSTDATNSADAYLYQATVNGGANGFASIDLVATLNGITDLTSADSSTFTLA